MKETCVSNPFIDSLLHPWILFEVESRHSFKYLFDTENSTYEPLNLVREGQNEHNLTDIKYVLSTLKSEVQSPISHNVKEKNVRKISDIVKA